MATLPDHDPALASASFDKLRALFAALPPDALLPVRADVRPLLISAFATSQAARETALAARLAKLPAEELSANSAQLLDDAAWALWHARSQLERAMTPAESTPLPVELTERANVLRERMLRVLRYWFEDDAELGKTLSLLARKKPAANELGPDLLKLATLYRERHETLKADARHYKIEDAPDAESTAAAISTQLNAASADGVRLWTEQLSRAQAVLTAVHADVRAAALYLLRKDPTAPERFPELSARTAIRGRPRKQAEASPSQPPPVAAPVEPAPVEVVAN